jgi:hypothetical protein
MLTQLPTDIENGDESAILQDGIQLIQQVITIVNALETIGTQLGNIASSLGMNESEVKTFAENLAENLLNYLLISYLQNLEPSVVGILNL